jgi:hypothetical protein
MSLNSWVFAVTAELLVRVICDAQFQREKVQNYIIVTRCSLSPVISLTNLSPLTIINHLERSCELNN